MGVRKIRERAGSKKVKGGQKMVNIEFLKLGKYYVSMGIALVVLVTSWGCGMSTPFGKGKKAFQQGKYEEASKEFEKAVAAGSDLYHSHLYLGRIHAIQKDCGKGVDECKKALDIAPKLHDAYTFLIVIYQLNNQPREAERLWDKATNLPAGAKAFGAKRIMPSPTRKGLRPETAAYYMDILKGTVSK